MELLTPQPTLQKPSPVMGIRAPTMPKRGEIRLAHDHDNLIQLYEILLENSFGKKFIKYKYLQKQEEVRITSHGNKRQLQIMPAPAQKAVTKAVTVTNYIDNRFGRIEIFHEGRSDFKTPTALILPQEDARQQNPRTLLCPICKASYFFKKEYLEAHIMLHYNKTCDQCGKKFLSLNNLNRHKDEECIVKNSTTFNHTNEILTKEDCSGPVEKIGTTKTSRTTLTPISSIEKPFKCLYCFKDFKFEKTFVRHQLDHIVRIGRYRCAYCDHKYSAKRNLIRHIKKLHSTCLPKNCV